MNTVVTIDGLSGSGKSTLAKHLAQKLHWSHCDTGALYRAVTFAFLEAGVVEDSSAIEMFLQRVDLCFEAQKIFLDGREISSLIRSMAVNDRVSELSQLACVRQFLFGIQREILYKGCVVMEGRDIGTSICPEAKYKFYLETSPKERALRRFRELKRTDSSVSLEEIENNLQKRDSLDSQRKNSPIVLPKDALVIQGDNYSIEGLLDYVYGLVVAK